MTVVLSLALPLASASAESASYRGTNVSWNISHGPEVGEHLRVTIKSTQRRSPKATVKLLRATDAGAAGKTWNRALKRTKRSGLVKTPRLEQGDYRLVVWIAGKRRASSEFRVSESPSAPTPTAITPAAAPQPAVRCEPGQFTGTLTVETPMVAGGQALAATFTNTSARCSAYSTTAARWVASDGTESAAQTGFVDMSAPRIGPGASFSIQSVVTPAAAGEYDLTFTLLAETGSAAGPLVVAAHVVVTT